MTPLYGHEDAVAAFRAGLAAGRLHHAWLLAGPKGIGKALFADKAALRVLADAAGPPVAMPGLEVPDDHPTARLIAAAPELLEALEELAAWVNRAIVPEYGLRKPMPENCRKALEASAAAIAKATGEQP